MKLNPSKHSEVCFNQARYRKFDEHGKQVFHCVFDINQDTVTIELGASFGSEFTLRHFFELAKELDALGYKTLRYQRTHDGEYREYSIEKYVKRYKDR